MKILFIHEIPKAIDDGLSAALDLISLDHEVTKVHVQDFQSYGDAEFVLGQGSFISRVHDVVSQAKVPHGLLIAGVHPPVDEHKHDVIWYENDWYRPMLEHKNIYHAFGVNTKIFKPQGYTDIVWNYVSVGSYSAWKRHEKIMDKSGYKLVIGEIQKNNPIESFEIIGKLLASGVMVSPMVSSKQLALIYSVTDTVYVPATTHGGGERVVLEARACGCKVEIEPDNPKLAEYMDCKIYDQKYYAAQILKGINSCIK